MCFCPDQSTSPKNPQRQQKRRPRALRHWQATWACCCRTHPRPIMEVYAMQGLIGVNNPFNEAWFVCFFFYYFEVSLDFHQFLWFQNKPHVWPFIFGYTWVLSLAAIQSWLVYVAADARSCDADSVQEKCWISTAHSFILPSGNLT